MPCSNRFVAIPADHIPCLHVDAVGLGGSLAVSEGCLPSPPSPFGGARGPAPGGRRAAAHRSLATRLYCTNDDRKVRVSYPNWMRPRKRSASIGVPASSMRLRCALPSTSRCSLGLIVNVPDTDDRSPSKNSPVLNETLPASARPPLEA